MDLEDRILVGVEEEVQGRQAWPDITVVQVLLFFRTPLTIN
jgi:hypothetical protein